MKKQELKALIAKAFAANKYPGDWCLKGSTEGCEPYQVEQEFKGKKDWQALDSKFLDQAPGGLASALSFFSDEAFRFYLAAYLIADIDNRLENVDVLFHLTHGLDNKSRSKKINPLRYGERTWWDEKQYQFSVFSLEQKKAIVEYLKFKYGAAEFDRPTIKQALNNYWLPQISQKTAFGMD
jgi:hypothetical protein